MKSFLKTMLPALLVGSLVSLNAVSFANTVPASVGLNTSPAYATKSSENNNMHERWKARHEAEENAILDQLNLTPEQRKKLDAIKVESKTQGKASHMQMRQQHKDFETYLFSSGATEQGANAKIEANAQQMTEMGKMRVKTLFKMRAVMTPEQFQKFGTLHRERWENKMQHHHPHAPGQ